MIRLFKIILLITLLTSCEKPTKNNKLDVSYLLGGTMNTVLDDSENAMTFPSPGLTGMDELHFFVGNSFFNQNWVSAPASTTARDGLGPFFNAKSCSGCHIKDGRGRPPSDNEISTGLLLRFWTGETDEYGAPSPDPNYGNQLQDRSVPEATVEGMISIEYEYIEGEYPDGTKYTLQKPIYSVNNPQYGNYSKLAPRIARQLIGLGLIEAISEDSMQLWSDPNDDNNDGISGRINMVYDKRSNSYLIGKIGWKAEEAGIYQQVSKAFSRDIGITTELFIEQNGTEEQLDTLELSDAGTPEIEEEDLMKVVLYMQNLGVPVQRNYGDEDIIAGKQLFINIGCNDCHREETTTGNHEFENLSNQKIYPYTDNLLHNMGGMLADERVEYDAQGNEWRTPSLWGIGLFETVNGHTRYLHDGRARNIEEAILWHGGEAGSRKKSFMSLEKEERDKLIKFLNSL